MTTTIVHGGLPENLRDRGGVFAASASTEPTAKLAAARSKVTELKRKHADAQSTLRLAVDDYGGTYDFQSLKSNVHRLARELSEAEEQAEQWAAVSEQTDKANRERRFHEALKEAREAREEFTEHFKQACLALGQWCSLGAEIRTLVNELADRLPNGGVYRQPHLNEALQEVDENINPLAGLRDSREFGEIQTVPTSWLRTIHIVPLTKKGE